MSEEYKRILESSLWKIANILRGKMNADEYRNYILGLIFYKFLSDKLILYANNALKADEILYTDIDENSVEGKLYLDSLKNLTVLKLGYFLLPSQLFSSLAKRGSLNLSGSNDSFILSDLQNVLKHIEDSTKGAASENDFMGLFGDMELKSPKLGNDPNAINKMIAEIMVNLDKVDFRLDDIDADVLGDAYEYLISQFASSAGKKAGEFYTPQQVSKILAKIVTTGKSELKSVYDATCGSGSLLLRVAREIKVDSFFGQESNPTTYNLARMNMLLHGVHYRDFDIRKGDSLENPFHIDNRFHAIVANPPFSISWSASPLFLSDPRFSQAGKLPPSSKADYAFVEHMLYHLAENGTMAIILPHGALFRGAAEGHIRQYLIQDKNYLDAVIGLPANLFFGAGIAACILVFKKCRENPKDILIIDARKYFEKGKTQNFLREDDVNRIVQTYRDRSAQDKYSRVVPLSEIEENEYNLNIPRYIKNETEEEKIDLEAINGELESINKELSSIDKIIDAFCNELNIAKPI